ncbi:D-alanine--D-alanine ligase [Enhygromyxa salina]|uniref:D-alanine--D-alanine ligase n=1 Tax=Enhygromyxa salina TaxID=215803 RepID=A0A0C2CQJ5_9BACT|nr:ATP-grasp domain-containing protein [Enhygromyxa salina]KIG13456.1 D-alanine--D-alanine ligase [Enhygromyxa salina]
MGTLTLGIIVPAGSSMRGASGADNPRARASAIAANGTPPGAGGLLDGEAQTARDLRDAARALGIACELAVIPAYSDDPDFELRPVTDVLRRLGGVDKVMIASHGDLGGSGRVHAAARACGLDVIGPSEAAISQAYDKLLTRQVLSHCNLPVPHTIAIGPNLAATAIDLDRLGWPGVIKPRRGADGIGVRRLDSASEVAAAADEARVGDELLLEREIVGRELCVVVLEGKVLGVAELERDFVGSAPRTRAMVCPPQLDPQRRAGLENLALRACSTLKLSNGPTRVDMLISERDNEVVLEVEPLPPLHRASVVARVARAAGLSYPRLCAQLIFGRSSARVAPALKLAAPLHA